MTGPHADVSDLDQGDFACRSSNMIHAGARVEVEYERDFRMDRQVLVPAMSARNIPRETLGLRDGRRR